MDSNQDRRLHSKPPTPSSGGNLKERASVLLSRIEEPGAKLLRRVFNFLEWHVSGAAGK
jgi:hypothetical protein